MELQNSNKVRIGISGWSYPQFRGVLYPVELKSPELLSYYASQFSSVEVNSTFYRFSRKTTFAKWAAQTPSGFSFAVKAPKYFTHIHRLNDPDGRMVEFFGSLEGFGDKLGPVLFQLPPSLKADAKVLKSFIGLLPKGFRITFEFRDESWYEPKFLEILDKAEIAFCISDIRAKTSPRYVTADFAYIRLHGPSQTPYRDAYSNAALQDWAGFIDGARRKGNDVFFYFDNTITGDAVTDARRLMAGLAESRMVNSSVPLLGRDARI